MRCLVEAVEKLMQPVPCLSRGQRVAVGSRGQGEAVRHADPGPTKMRIELAQRSILAAHQRLHRCSAGGEPPDVPCFQFHRAGSLSIAGHPN